MTKRRRRKCLNCGMLFRPDPRNVRHQRYCSAGPCRKVSKAASQARWLSKPQSRNYFRGPAFQKSAARTPCRFNWTFRGLCGDGIPREQSAPVRVRRPTETNRDYRIFALSTHQSARPKVAVRPAQNHNHRILKIRDASTPYLPAIGVRQVRRSNGLAVQFEPAGIKDDER